MAEQDEAVSLTVSSKWADRVIIALSSQQLTREITKN